jgi:hypothetical protein
MYGQAIVVKYRGPTSTRGSRYIASAQAGRVTKPCDYALDNEANKAAAARALAEKYGWAGTWVGGALPGGAYVFVRVEGSGIGGAVAFTLARRDA